MTAVQMPVRPASRALLTATVYAPDGVLFAASSDGPRALAAQIVDYVVARCDDVLWPADAAAVRAHIEHDDAEAAIATYFASVGDRWDAEWLERSCELERS